MIEKKDLPKAIMSWKIKIWNIELDCFTLEDWTPMIDAESLVKFIKAMESWELLNAPKEDLENLAKFIHSKPAQCL